MPGVRSRYETHMDLQTPLHRDLQMQTLRSEEVPVTPVGKEEVCTHCFRSLPCSRETCCVNEFFGDGYGAEPGALKELVQFCCVESCSHDEDFCQNRCVLQEFVGDDDSLVKEWREPVVWNWRDAFPTNTA